MPEHTEAMNHQPSRPTLRDIDLICYDFDGVMTDNRALVSEDGTEAVWVHRGDGLAIEMLGRAGVRQVIVSKERNPVVSARGAKLGLPVLQGIDDKLDIVTRYAAENHIALDRTLYVGNDINDLQAMAAVAHAVAPSDAHPQVLAEADHVTASPGGRGVIRELYDLLMETGT